MDAEKAGFKVAVEGTTNARDAFLGTRNGKTWMPAEFDVSLRPGWFYHPGEDGDGFRISAFDEECAQAAIRELCAKLRGESAAEDIVEIKAEQLPGERGGLMRKIRTNGGE